MKKILLLLCLIASLTVLLNAQTLLETQFSGPLGSGARAMGMGGAFIAVADDATATSWNPGGLGQIENIEISAVGSYYDFNRVEPSTTFFDNYIGSAFHTGNSWSFDFIGVSIPIRPFSDSDFKLVLQYSFQRLINFNVSSHTNAISFQHLIREWEGGQQSLFLEEGYIYKDEIYSGGLDSHSISLGIKMTSWLNLGFTVNIWTNGFEGNKYIEESFHIVNLITQEEATGFRNEVINTEGNFSGTSFNLGALLHITDNLNVGFVYKTEFNFEDKTADGVKKGEVHYPQSMGLGFAYRPIENLTLALDGTFTEWSKGWAKYNGVQTYFPMNDLPYMETIPEDRKEFKDTYQHDTYQIRFGGEYVIITPEFLIPLRAGIYFDRQFFADANQTTPLYTGVSAGAGIVWNGIVLDVAVVYVSADFKSEYFATSNTDFEYIKGIASVIFRF